MKTRKHKIILGFGIGLIAIIILFILFFINICSSQAKSKTYQVESDKQEKTILEKEPLKEEITAKIEGKESSEDKYEKPAAEQKKKVPEQKTIMFKVEAKKEWQYPGIEVTPETNIIISYEKGKWSRGAGWLYTDAEGYPRINHNQMFPEISLGALVGRIGMNKPFKIGNYCEISVANMTGKLALIMNDNPGWRQNNKGSITVKIIVQ